MKKMGKAYMNAYLKDRYHRLKRLAMDALGNTCAWCGGKDRLTFDHRNLNDKSFNITPALRSRPLAQIKVELKKCQLLCRSCHTKKTNVERAALGYRGEKMGSAKLTEDDVRGIRLAIIAGKSLTGTSKVYGVSPYAIHCIKVGKTWGHVK